MMTTPTSTLALEGVGRANAADLALARVRAHARLLSAWTERLWSEGLTSLDQGLAITPGEVRRILRDPEEEQERYRLFAEEHEHAALADAAAATDRAFEDDPFWSHLAATFALSRAELDLLCLLAAVELDPRLGRVLAYVADDTRATQPTLAIAAALFRWALPAPGLTPALVRWRLAHPLEGAAWQARSTWQVDESVMHSLRAQRWTDPRIEKAARFSSDANALPCLYPEVLAEMLAASSEPQLTLVGPEGSGRATLAAQYAAALGRPLLVVDTPALLALAPASFGTAAEALTAACRLAHASGALVYFRSAVPSQAAEGISATDGAAALAPLTLVGALTAPATRHFLLKPLTTARRLDAWAHYSEAAPSSMLLAERLMPAEIKAAATLGARPARLPQNGELLQALACPYGWDDLVISADLGRTLRDFEAQVRLRWQVYEDWGFERLTHLGRGISALFGGPSGTGKTMAAQVLARSLGVELYRVDLAGVVNKYIGETEKRLRDVFDACERSGALLFFDEADALFGKRMQVKEAHDRFANIEIDYLLQCIEQFNGISILATNRKNDLDSAFLRRLRFVVDFLPPGKPERLLLWHKALTPCAPSGEAIGPKILGEIDFALLASELDVNGAEIKAIALGAAFLACAEGTRIEMQHIELAAQRELAKQGLRLRAPLVRTEARL